MTRQDARPGVAVRAESRVVTPVLLLAALSVAMAQTIVVAALPVFQRELRTSVTGAAWLLTAFMLAAAVATPLSGGLGDRVGYRRVLAGCLLCAVTGSLVAVVANDAGSLGGVLAGRVLQGFAAGVFPLAFGIARTFVPQAKLPGVVAALSAVFGVGGALGMVVAGPLVDEWGTMSLFWTVLLLTGCSLAGATRLPAGPAAARPVRTGPVDVVGTVLLAGALGCLLLGISQGRMWAPAGIVGLFAAAVVLAAAFGWVEVRVARPLVDLRLLRERALLSTNVATVVVSTAMFAAVALLPQFVQTPPRDGYGFAASAAGTGLLMLPMAVLMIVCAPLATRLAARAGARVPLRAGAVLAAVAFVLLAGLHDRLWECYLAGAILGAGYGLAFAALGTLVVDAVPPRHTGSATAINTILRTTGGAIGAQLSAALLSASVSAGTWPPAESGYTQAFLVFAGLAVLTLVPAAAIPHRGSRRQT
jgi:MFS family permease